MRIKENESSISRNQRNLTNDKDCSENPFSAKFRNQTQKTVESTLVYVCLSFLSVKLSAQAQKYFSFT